MVDFKQGVSYGWDCLPNYEPTPGIDVREVDVSAVGW